MSELRGTLPAGEPLPIAVPGGECTLYPDAPGLQGHRTAAFGHFHCDSMATGQDLMAAVISAARDVGATALLGPMAGDTWHSYRFVTHSDGRPAFLLEPENPPWYPDVLTAAGMEPVAAYASAINKTIRVRSPGLGVGQVTVRHWDISNSERELRLIHSLALSAFSKRPFFRPIDYPDFAAIYRPILRMIDPELIFFAENEAGDLLGFLFALPNHFGADAAGEGGEQLIVKSYASARPGIGGLLANRFHEAVLEREASSVIYALFEVTNLSARHSEREGGKIFRRYALWGSRL